MASNLQPRECIVTKQEGMSFGFFLRIEKDIIGHLIRSVDATGAAAKAGLKDGDRVLRVNGVFVEHIEHPQVVDLIKAKGNTVNLLVLDGASYENAKKRGDNLENLDQNQPARPLSTNKVSIAVQKPRLCYLVKDKKGYGFSLKTSPGQTGLFITSLVPEGAAAKAGVRDNDRLIEVNGQNMEKATHELVAAKVKQSGDSVVFLLADRETDKFYSDPKKTLTGEMADLTLLPLKPRTVELKKGPDGYGFYLKEEKGKKGNFIRDIDVGSPAEKSILKDGDRVVAVNGTSVEAMEHEAVVETIHKGGDKTSLLVVDAETDHLYMMAGFSPILYGRGAKEPVKVEPAVTTASVVNYAPSPAPATAPATTPAPATSPAPAAATRSAPAPTPNPAPSANGEIHYKARLCHLVKGPTGYGFHLNAIKNMPGQFIKEVTPGGPADVAGVQDDDILVEVNGANVETASYEDVVMRIREAMGNLTLLVSSSEAYDYFKAHNIPIVGSQAELIAYNAAPPSYTETMTVETEKPAPTPQRKATSSSSSDESPKNGEEEEDDTQL